MGNEIAKCKFKFGISLRPQHSPAESYQHHSRSRVRPWEKSEPLVLMAEMGVVGELELFWSQGQAVDPHEIVGGPAHQVGFELVGCFESDFSDKRDDLFSGRSDEYRERPS